MTNIEPTTTRDIADNWPYQFQRVTPDSPLYQYLGVYATEMSRLDAFIDTLYEQRFIQTASSKELEKLAAEINVTRHTDETDEQFRKRIQLRRVQATSNGTAADIAELLRTAFPNGAQQIEITTSPSAPVLRLQIPQSLIDNALLSETTLQDIFNDAMPCGSSIQFVTEDVFTFVEDDDAPPAYAGGFDEGVWTN